MKARGTEGPPSVAEVLPILHEISILGGITDEQLVLVIGHMRSIACRAGDCVFEQGQSPTDIYIVRTGRVRIVVDLYTRPLELVDFGVGACFGETSVIAIEPHAASAVAVEDTVLLALPRASLFAIYHEDARLFGMLVLNIAREACRRLHKTDELMLHYFMEK